MSCFQENNAFVWLLFGLTVLYELGPRISEQTTTPYEYNAVRCRFPLVLLCQGSPEQTARSDRFPGHPDPEGERLSLTKYDGANGSDQGNGTISQQERAGFVKF